MKRPRRHLDPNPKFPQETVNSGLSSPRFFVQIVSMFQWENQGLGPQDINAKAHDICDFILTDSYCRNSLMVMLNSYILKRLFILCREV